MMPKVSICLPVYNGERFLSEAIESALGQAFTDFELLISDDASTDRSAAIAQEYAAKDTRIRFWRNEQNKGLFANYNECLQRAQGSLIKPFAQDDILAPQCVERLVEAFEHEPELSLAAVSKLSISETGSCLSAENDFGGPSTGYGRDIIRESLIQQKNIIGEPSTVMFRSQLKGTGFDTSYYHLGDLEYWLRILHNGRFQFIDEPLCSFRQHAASATSRNLLGLLFALDILKLSEVHADIVAELGYTLEEYKMRSIRLIAAFVAESSKRGQISLDDLLKQVPLTGGEAQRQLEGFKQLAFYSLLYSHSAVEKLETQIVTSNQKLADVLNSRYWKSGRLVREAARLLREHRTTKQLH